jgi:hypothetical protein
MTYAEKLKNPLWQKKRLEVFDRDNYTCTVCEDKDTELHVHHKEYSFGKEPWEYDIENFTTLCKHCHEFITFYTKAEPNDTIVKYNKYKPTEGVYLFYILVYSPAHSKYFLLGYKYNNYNDFECISSLTGGFIESVFELMQNHKKTTNG